GPGRSWHSRLLAVYGEGQCVASGDRAAGGAHGDLDLLRCARRRHASRHQDRDLRRRGRAHDGRVGGVELDRDRPEVEVLPVERDLVVAHSTVLRKRRGIERGRWDGDYERVVAEYAAAPFRGRGDRDLDLSAGTAGRYQAGRHLRCDLGGRRCTYDRGGHRGARRDELPLRGTDVEVEAVDRDLRVRAPAGGAELIARVGESGSRQHDEYIV